MPVASPLAHLPRHVVARVQPGARIAVPRGHQRIATFQPVERNYAELGDVDEFLMLDSGTLGSAPQRTHTPKVHGLLTRVVRWALGRS